jgi:hypothetical protein
VGQTPLLVVGADPRVRPPPAIAQQPVTFNHPRNGIASSKNAHSNFDQGLWTIVDDYRIIVAVRQFAESGSNNDNPRAIYHGRRFHLPEDWPWSSWNIFDLDNEKIKLCPMQIDYVQLPQTHRG